MMNTKFSTYINVWNMPLYTYSVFTLTEYLPSFRVKQRDGNPGNVLNAKQEGRLKVLG